MLLRSSIHIFTTAPKNVVKCLVDECPTPQQQRAQIAYYFEKVDRMRDRWETAGPEELPLHGRDRFYIREYLAAYPEGAPPLVVQREFERRGVPLNIWGDILVAPQAVSVLSSRLFTCGAGLDDPAACEQIRSASTRFRRKIISYSWVSGGTEGSECRVYFGAGRRVACLSRGGGHDGELSPELLPDMWPEIPWPSLLAEADSAALSDHIKDTFHIPVEEDLTGYSFSRSEGLYNIYYQKE